MCQEEKERKTQTSVDGQRQSRLDSARNVVQNGHATESRDIPR